MKIPNFLTSILPKNNMSTLAEILIILEKQPYIHFSVENHSVVWRGEWLVSLNMMNGKGAQFFHNTSFSGALKEALKFLKNYPSE